MAGRTVPLHAQAPPARLPSFEVASVKENTSGDTRARIQTLPGGRVAATNVAVMLTSRLSNGFGPVGDQGRLVFDKTGLSGRFAFVLEWTPEQLPTGTPPPGIPPIDPNGPSFFTALQEQLGLKLESAKGPVDVLIVDSVKRPTPD